MEKSSLTISKKDPEYKSMQYKTLRELAIQHIQQMAGKIWTDYNSHDPGVTILEVLSYAITDLGYRTSFDIKDLLAPAHYDDPDPQNFYTAAQILPGRPLTIGDYRKLLIDVEVVNEKDDSCRFAGVKNAWIIKSDVAEQAIFVNHKDSVLSLEPVSPDKEQDSYYVKTLYDVLLEFDECEKFGDLNENTIEADFVLYEHEPDELLKGLAFNIRVQFPVWDSTDVNWQDQANVQSGIRSVRVNISNLPQNYTLTAEITNLNNIILKGSKTVGGTTSPIAGMDKIIEKINDFIYQPETGLLPLYIEKVNKVFEIADACRIKLNSNRNLCEDFFRFRAVRVEEIIVCADIEIETAADVDQVEARIFNLISSFLSPKVHFYTPGEMLNKCHDMVKFPVISVNRAKQSFTITRPEEDSLTKDDIITVFGADNNRREYTLLCVENSPDKIDQLDLTVSEEIPEDGIEAGDLIIKGRFNEDECITVDQVFEGPLLRHGFIDNRELAAADRKEVIRVSDLIHLIMGVEGVIAVKEIQIANLPQNNELDIESKSVRWCMELAFDHNYVPRLNATDSRITYYKEQLPLLAKRTEVERLTKKLKDAEKPQKIRYPGLDLPWPAGKFRNPGDYTSIQEDFPYVYGIGSGGIQGLDKLLPAQQEQRKIQVTQLKGYLLLFEQYLANYLAQLANIKNLFTMQDKTGEAYTDKTYYTRKLTDIVPDGNSLFRNLSDHKETLQHITEDTQLFERRRNKFLDHLLGRFAENFTDYAMLAAKISGHGAPRELIADKLKFLGCYPELSSNRGGAMDYSDHCRIWHIDNVSGIEKRGELLLGMSPGYPDKLMFRDPFKIGNSSGSVFNVFVEDSPSNVLMKTDQDFKSEEEARSHLENIIVAGVFIHNYQIRPAEGGGFYFVLNCNGQILGRSAKSDYSSDAPDGDAITDIYRLVELCKAELYENPEANRRNLACPLKNYIDYDITVDMSPAPAGPPTYTIRYALYKNAFTFTEENKLLEGSVKQEADTGDPEDHVHSRAEEALYKVLWDLVTSGVHRVRYRFDPESSPFNSPYFFKILNSRGEEIARSVDIDFNQEMAGAIISASSAELQVEGSTENNGEYEIISASANGPYVKIGVNPAPVSPVFDGYLMTGSPYDISFIEKNSANIILNDIDPEIFEGDTIYLNNTEKSNGFYTVQSIRRSEDKVYLKVNESFVKDETSGRLRKAYSIAGIEDNNFVIKGGREEQAITQTINFIEEKFFSREGFHVLEHLLLRPREDDILLPVHLEQECTACKITDPYSNVVSVVVPYWPGRFINLDFRKFVERKLRLEAPAHVLLNICWISCEHMHLFEEKYKKWLVAINTKDVKPNEVSVALAELIDILTRMRNVYPTGKLHDCRETGSLEGAVILNNSVLGTF